jgi:hypothetical protein
MKTILISATLWLPSLFILTQIGLMGQKCRKYSKARKNRLISAPEKQNQHDKNKHSIKRKCKKV